MVEKREMKPPAVPLAPLNACPMECLPRGIFFSIPLGPALWNLSFCSTGVHPARPVKCTVATQAESKGHLSGLL